MSAIKSLSNEIQFSAKDRTLWLWLFVVLSLACLSLGFGLVEVNQQKATLKNLIHADSQDRTAESAKVKDWGSAAYYNFHLTYAPPSEFAFAAIGQRDEQPWKHRVRMLALEGQIYERDVGNPSLALIGRFDFSFLAAFVLPLILILLLFDLRASERSAGRFNLLESTAHRAASVWRLRATIRVSAVLLCLVAPMVIVGWFSGTRFTTLMSASFIVFVYAACWSVLCYKLSAWQKPGSVILMTLISVWLFTAVVIPASSRLIVDRLVPLPSGAEILMLQRETVNNAWDIPREETMDVFFEHHPQWSDYQAVQGGFEWQWYYAFQQAGDQATQGLSKTYLEGRLQRDHIAGYVALLAPPSLLERKLQSLAKTNLAASIAYEQEVRLFHAKLRAYYYPKFFRNEAFSKSALENLPEFSPTH